jgi:hypothetical protein
MVITADHGQTPESEATGSWPISKRNLEQSMARHFDVAPEDFLQGTRPGHVWLTPEAEQSLDITPADVANFLVGYRLQDNVEPGQEVPVRYRERAQDPLFAAAWPADQMGRVWRCVKDRAR